METAANMKKIGVFSRTLADQIHSFKTYGFVMIKNTANIANDLTDLEIEILRDFSINQNSITYKIWRFFNSVTTPTGRHSVPLRISPILHKNLLTSIGSLRPFLDSQLTSNAPLVELSSIISMPRSLEQEAHADTSFFTVEHSILSVFVALSPVPIECGPTCFIASSNNREFHRRYTHKATNYYSSDGISEDYLNEIDIDDSTQVSSSSYNINTEEIAYQEPIYAVLGAGDMVIFDSKVVHYGSANSTKHPRTLLHFSFQQQNNGTREFDVINGFTYHMHNSTRNRYQLYNFPYL